VKLDFNAAKPHLPESFAEADWQEESGISEEKLRREIDKIEGENLPKAIKKAKTFETIVMKSRIAVTPYGLFQNKILGYRIMREQRLAWEAVIKETKLKSESERVSRAWKEFGAYHAMGDYGHTSPNSSLLLSVGFSGLLERIDAADGKAGLTEKQKNFYHSCRIVLKACIAAALRLAKAASSVNPSSAECLKNIAYGAPKNSYEAMQLLLIYFFLHEYVGATRVRTLGRLDVLLQPFYRRDLEKGTFTKEEIKEMLKFFLYEFHTAKVPFDLPFCLGGMKEDGEEATCEISYWIVEAYRELKIHSPKIHIRVSPKTPKDFLLQVLDCIRNGISSFVFINDLVGIQSLVRAGISERDAKNFVPIGCYEPAVWGVEMGCTGNGGINLPKALEFVFLKGCDFRSGTLVGIPQEEPKTYEEFLLCVREQIANLIGQAIHYIVRIERYYSEINPDPLLSCQYDRSVELGIDVFEGGARYNNSSLQVYALATLVDGICAVKRLVYEENRYTFSQLRDILKADWCGFENERLLARNLKEKYGTGNPVADELTRDLAHFCADLINGTPNGRGGVFKAGIFTIDHYIKLGKQTMATPDGRHAGDPLSKNLSATVGMDRNGITALIQSVTKIDFSKFPTGSVLDIMLHPSAVKGEEGLEAFYIVLKAYFKKGGFALHGNVFDAETLKKAQKNPEVYRTLQVRVCGWNAYFVNLSLEEQNCLIRQAEGLE